MNNRELKFRVWDHQENAYNKYEYWIDAKSGDTYRMNSGGIDYQLTNFCIQQYTGLKDKNGREIYEGDIIQLENAPYKYEVVWNKWHWGIDSKGIVTDFIQSFTIAVEERCIVIGNIFENPDLLK